MVLARILVLATIVILSNQHTLAFSPVVFRDHSFGIRAATESSVDLSIEYDAPAKLAYNQWREQYNKGDFDDVRYDAFKINYEALTVVNVVAAKEARESGEDYKKLELNEFADFTTEEYLATREVVSVTEPVSFDLTIEYDAAAKLAYNQWREQYNKGDFDDDRYDAFKANYEALTVANVIAAKEARESGEDYKKLEFDEFADTVGVVSVAEPVSVDLTIEYDAAAKLAYNQWREQYNKGDFDDVRYDAFKANYEALTVVNVIAAKEARESGEDYKKLELNEFADFTTEEYLAIGEEEAVISLKDEEATNEAPSGGVMGTIMESSAAQNEATNAIEEANAAVTEEEQKLAEMLGLESVEDLEATIDAMDGIAEDGSELDPSNISNDAEDLEVTIDGMDGIAEDGGELDPANISEDADVRSAYLSWCEEFGKEIDESRYPTFMFNYLAMYNLAKESGDPMELNMYADYTEDEFIAATSKESPAVDTETSPEISAGEDAVPETVADTDTKKDVAIATSMAKENKAKEEEALAEARERENAAAIALAEEQAAIEADKRKVEAEAAKIAKEEAAKKAVAMTQEAAAAQKKVQEANSEKVAAANTKRAEIAKAVEDDKKKRQSAQDKALTDARAASEAASIAAAKEIAEKDAIRETKTRELDDLAKEILMKQAREAEEKLASKPRTNPNKSVGNVPPKRTTRSAAPAPKAIQKSPKPARKKTSPVAEEKTRSASASKKIGSSSTQPQAEGEPTWLRIIKKVAGVDDNSSTNNTKNTASVTTKKTKKKLNSVSSPQKKAAPKKILTPVAKNTEQPKKFQLFQSSSSVKKAATPAPAKKLDAKKKVPVKKAPTPAKKKTLALAEKKIPAPAQKKSWGTFTIKTSQGKGNEFGVKAKPASTQGTKPVVKKESFSFFGNKTTLKKDPKTPVPKKVVTPARTNSWGTFNIKAATKSQAKPAPAPAPARKKWGTFRVKSATEAKVTPSSARVPKPVGKKNPFSFFNSKPANDSDISKKKKNSMAPAKSIPKDDIPIISNWVREADGSITGRISNSPNFRKGQTITTSPARGVAKAGRVVVTVSGSKYRLM